MSADRGQGPYRGRGTPNAHPRQQQWHLSPNNSQQFYNMQQNYHDQPWGGSSSESWDTEGSYDQSYSSNYSSQTENYSHNSSSDFNTHSQARQHHRHEDQSPMSHPSAHSTPIRPNDHRRSTRDGRDSRDRSNSREHQKHTRDGSFSHDTYNTSGYSSKNNSFNKRGYRRDDDPLVFLSKTLSSILRHNAEKFGFKLMKGGFLYVDDILQKTWKLRDQGFTVDDVVHVVRSNDKQRFTLDHDEHGRLKIRANQGHTMEVADLDLRPITKADDFPLVIHGTYNQAWEIIKQTGLNRMERNHIHFAPGEPGVSGVISGMRASCEVMIYLDLEKALKDGLKFFISSNNVILSPGDEFGSIHPRYFAGAKDRYKGHRLPFNPNVDVKPEAESYVKESRNKRKKGKSREKNDKKDNKNQSYLSEGSTDNSLEPPSKMPALEKNKEKPSDSSTVRKTEDVVKTSQAADTEVLSNLRKDYGSESGDQDEDSEVEDTEADPINEIEAIIEVDDPDTSKNEIQNIVSREPPFVVVICKGDRLGQEKSHIRQLAVGVDTSLYVFNLQSKVMMEEGSLKELLLNKKIQKVFSRVEEISFSLINEYGIVLNGVPIWDLEILYEKLPSQMKNKDNEALKKLNIEDGMFEKWSKTNRKSEERTEDLTQQAVMMYRMFEIFKKSLDSQSSHVKTIKTETYKKAIPSVADHFLSQKIKALKLAEKDQKKKEKGTGQQAAGGSAHDKQQEHESKGGDGGGKNKKKKKRR